MNGGITFHTSAYYLPVISRETAVRRHGACGTPIVVSRLLEEVCTCEASVRNLNGRNGCEVVSYWTLRI
jgi:hypothetical protein